MEELQLDAEGSRISVNAEFYRKMTQQLVQKDNIIKLLRLQIENLRSANDQDGSSLERRQSDESRIEQLRDELEKISQENEQLRRRIEDGIGSSFDDGRRDREAADAADADLRALQERHERLQDEFAKRVRQFEEERDDLARRVVELTDELTLVRSREAEPSSEDPSREAELQEELSRALEALSTAESAAEEARAESRRLHRRLREARDEQQVFQQERDEALKQVEVLTERIHDMERLAESLPDVERLEAERDKAVAEAEAGRRKAASLRSELEKLSETLATLREEAAHSFDKDDLRLFTALVHMHEELLLRCENGLPADVASSVEAAFEAVGLQRIETLGSFFDETLHRPVQTVYGTEYPNGTVVKELGGGYRVGGMVLKPADVVVSRDPYWCETCSQSASPGSRYCNVCGGRLSIQDIPQEEEIRTGPRVDELVGLASAREAAGDVGEARELYERALTIDPSNRASLLGLARILEVRGDWKAALERYERLAAQGNLTSAEERGRRRLVLKQEILERIQDLF